MVPGGAKTCRRGLIPAGAGQITNAICVLRPAPAHPRRCGADSRASHPPAFRTGSSPQVRGRLARDAESVATGGLIPAGAGQILCILTPQLRKWAHPRRCGADYVNDMLSLVEQGSSPQVRGRFPDRPRQSWRKRLIPAGAGQIVRVPGAGTGARAHPRRCGADGMSMRTVPTRRGSSPQVRGRSRSSIPYVRCPRLIPAGAGQICLGSDTGCRGWAHPRRCGADTPRGRMYQIFPGSSPQVRGRCFLNSRFAAPDAILHLTLFGRWRVV